MAATESPFFKGAFLVGDIHVMPGCKAHAILLADKQVPNEYGGWMSAGTAARAIILDAIQKADNCYRIPEPVAKPKEEKPQSKAKTSDWVRPDISRVVPSIVKMPQGS